MSVLLWFINSRIGQAIILVLVILLCWWAFASHYTGVGVAKCEAAQAAKIAQANVDQAKKNEENNETSSELANDASEKTQDLIAESEDEAAKDKGVVHVIYRDRPSTTPLRNNSCVHPVDDRVQQRIDQAVNRANET